MIEELEKASISKYHIGINLFDAIFVHQCRLANSSFR